jgi:hypothetical protein
MKHSPFNTILKFIVYPIVTIANAPIAHSESDYHQIKDLGYLLFFKVVDKHCYAPG